ncbi:MAG TPA: hypothetical protein VFZ09_40195 [Archangium sp.]|uniref:hypothetical protein n=1 Tax=Archangium sp. TaxID=1872627 RepID=UPI002E348499|nr:hypothetical protein [Archangium sp.]HEX5752496.1 hypothetical protein [Archangium sp.]
MPSDDARHRLERAQAGFLRALTGSAPSPPGFERSDVEAAAESLASKRRRAVARTWPSLARALGDGFRERFDAFARQTPLPARGGPLADGRAFIELLSREGPLPEAVSRQVLGVDLRFRRSGDGLVPRRGFSLVHGVLPASGYRLLGIRWAGHGERWFRLPAGMAVPVVLGRRWSSQRS